LAEDQNTSDLLLQAFSANYNWSLLDALNHVGNRDSIAYAVSGSVANYPSGTYPMNFITNHDENSWNGTEFQRLGNAVRESAAISFLTPGIPLLYNGQEIGMNHQLAFFEKDAIDWGSDPASSSWSGFYSKLISLRKNNPSLWSGSAGGKLSFIDTSATSVLSFARATKTNRVLLFANLSASAKRIHFRVAKSQAGSYFKYSDGKRIKLSAGRVSQVRIPAWSFVIYSSASAK
jgi:1,4-alpha-glucan branching enzyme